jgi:tetratricopeptide (TPR) repeat protein
LAETLARLNREEEAIEQYRASLNLDSEFVEARVELGNLLTDMGYEQEGIQLFRDGKKIHFDDPYFMYRFSGFLLEHGMNEEGLNNLQESLHNNLNDLSIFEEYHGDLLLIPSVKAIIDQFRC